MLEDVSSGFAPTSGKTFRMRGTRTALSPASDKVFPDGALAVAKFVVALSFSFRKIEPGFGRMRVLAHCIFGNGLKTHAKVR